MKEDIKKKAAAVTMLLLDVDGVLTDGSLYYDKDGEAIKRFDVRDGAALVWWKRAGFDVAVLTGRTSPQTDSRCRELGIDKVIQGAIRKLPVFNDFLVSENIGPDKIAFVGDDVHDLPIIKRAGVSFAPVDAVPEVIEKVDVVLDTKGGYGCVREAIEYLLKANGKWEEITAIYHE